MKEIDTFLKFRLPNEPIFVEDIVKSFPNHSRQWIDDTLKNMVQQNRIKRFSTGVYYIPIKYKDSESTLNPRIVIERKYIKNHNDVIGFYSGNSLLKEIGLLNRNPEMITVVTNREKSKGRKVVIGDKTIYLKKPPTEITGNNHSALRFLEAVRIMDFTHSDRFDLEAFMNFVKNSSVRISDVNQYCKFFPDEVSKIILSGEIINILVEKEMVSLSKGKARTSNPVVLL